MNDRFIAIQVGAVSFLAEGVCPVLDVFLERGGVKAAVLAAFAGGAQGVVLSRKYSEMRLDILSGAGDAVRKLS